MSETNDLPAPRKAGGRAPLVQSRLEESAEWVVHTYRKQALKEVSAWLDATLGEGDREKTYIRPVLLDVNPVRHRQSLQEQVFPVPRAIHESLLDVGKLKMMIEAGAGMGKTTFLKYCLEGLLQQEVHSVYPLPVYFHLGELPEGTGFAEFFDRGYRRMRDLILREQEELPDLELDGALVLRTLRALGGQSRMIFLVDGLDQLDTEDRFQVYHQIFIDDNAFRSNRVILASRGLEFGPLATEALLQRGKDACFRIAFQKIDARARRAYLGDAAENRTLQDIYPYCPELLEAPLFLRMIRLLSEHDRLDGVTGRGDLLDRYVEHVLEAGAPENDPGWAARCQQHLEDLAYRLMEAGRAQRFQDHVSGFEKELMDPGGGSPLLEAGEVPAALAPLIQQTPRRWEFRHPAFQEYFAARKLATRSDWPRVARAHCREEKWEGVLQFLAGWVPGRELYEILLQKGAIFLAGNALCEVKDLPRDQQLLTQHLLKYQCKETFPQFSRCRMVETDEVVRTWDKVTLDDFLVRLLQRKNRDSRILYAVLELLAARDGQDLNAMVDAQDFEALRRIPELQPFFQESRNPDQVNVAQVKRWTEQVTIPAGSFIYQDEHDEEDRVFLSEFSIMRYPVTNALYRQFDPNYRPLYPRYSSQADQPVLGVNYYEATVCALWLGMRLPQEKEWEKAARGTDGREYPWGEAAGYQSGYANTCDFLIGRTNPVQEFEQGISPYGCFDMAGNVWEWCVQLYTSRQSTQKVVRGGSWLNYLVHSKCKFRNTFDPAERHLTLGFRCVSGPRITEREDDEEDE